MAQIRIEGEGEGIGIVLSSMYPREIKGIDKIERKGNEIEIRTKTATRGHKESRFIRVEDNFNDLGLIKLVEELKKFEYSYIKDLIKQIFGKSIRALRHDLANDQLKYNITQISRALGHNSKKNMAYYLDYIEIAEDQGIDKALELINGTEDKRLFSLIRLAVRIELEIKEQSG